MTEGDTYKKTASDVIKQIWHRARINAFAHKNAMRAFSRWETVFFVLTITTSLLSVLAIILVYIFSSGQTENSTLENSSPLENKVVIYTFASIVLSVSSLFCSIMSSHLRFGIRAEEHKYLMNSYQHIAQRAREVYWPDKPNGEVVELLMDLERDFALLKARGNEPLNLHYIKAHKLFNAVKADKDTKIAQSFSFDAGKT